VVTISYRNQA